MISKKKELQAIKKIQSGKDYNIELDNAFYYNVGTGPMRLIKGNLVPEQWNGKRWVKC